MAIIRCPECGKEVSDHAPACIHCGFPLEQSYGLEVVSCGKPALLRNFLYQTFGIDLKATEKILSNLPGVVIEGISHENAAFFSSGYTRLTGSEIKVVETSAPLNAHYNRLADERRDTSRLPVVCPNCGSVQIATGTKGIALFGIGKTVNRCARCGHAWMP